MQRPRRWRACAAVLAIGVATGLAHTAELDDAMRAGQRMFQTGHGRDGAPVGATLAAGAVRLSGAAVACARCHGTRGDGTHEAGLATPPLAEAALTRPRRDGAGLPGRPAYDPSLLRRALRHGVDAGGRLLNPAMPRFSLAPQEEEDLFAYLRVLGSDADLAPGVSGDAVEVALVGDGSPASRAARDAALACLKDLNDRGGVFGRRVTWRLWDAASTADASAWRRLADRSALVLAPWWPDAEAFDDFARFAAAERLAVIGPVAPAARDVAPSSTVFHVAPDAGDALRVLVDHLAPRRAGHAVPVAVIVSPDGRDGEDVALMRRQWALHVEAAFEEVEDDAPAALAARLARLRPAAVVVLGDLGSVERADEALALAGLPDRTPLHALYARTGSGVTRLGLRARQRLELLHAHPLGAEADPRRMLALLRQQGVVPAHPAAQSLGYAAGCLAAEGLVRAGRRLTREGLVRGLETVTRFETGVTMPLTFGPRQRRGVWGARLVRVEGNGLAAVTSWRAPLDASR
ncbi:MAG TPA: ABC transporter substrate-binding protein [Albitalea sp.]